MILFFLTLLLTLTAIRPLYNAFLYPPQKPRAWSEPALVYRKSGRRDPYSPSEEESETGGNNRAQRTVWHRASACLQRLAHSDNGTLLSFAFTSGLQEKSQCQLSEKPPFLSLMNTNSDGVILSFIKLCDVRNPAFRATAIICCFLWHTHISYIL